MSSEVKRKTTSEEEGECHEASRRRVSNVDGAPLDRFITRLVGEYKLDAGVSTVKGCYSVNLKTGVLMDGEQTIGQFSCNQISTTPFDIDLVSAANREMRCISIENSEIMTEIQKPSNEGAYFVLPSQLNGAEYPDHRRIITQVDDYKLDNTGGPRGQLAVHPGAAQFVLDNAANETRHGQGINAIDEVLNRTHGFDLQNGYLKMPMPNDMEEAEHLLKTFLESLHTLRLLVMSGVQACGLTPNKKDISQMKHRVHLVYASAVPLNAYVNRCSTDPEKKLHVNVAEAVLVAQYYGALRTAAKNAEMQKTTVFLMPLGGGVFNNPWSSIAKSMSLAVEMLTQTERDKLLIKVLAWSGNPSEMETLYFLLSRMQKLIDQLPSLPTSASSHLEGTQDVDNDDYNDEMAASARTQVAPTYKNATAVGRAAADAAIAASVERPADIGAAVLRAMTAEGCPFVDSLMAASEIVLEVAQEHASQLAPEAQIRSVVDQVVATVKAAGGSPLDVAMMVGHVVTKAANEEGVLRPAETASVVSAAVRLAECGPAECAKSVSKAVADAVKATGLTQPTDIGAAVAEALTSAGYAFIDALTIAGEVTSEVAQEISTELTGKDHATYVISQVAAVVRAAGGGSLDVAKVVGHVTAKAATEQGDCTKPAELAAVVTVAARSAGCSAAEISQVANATLDADPDAVSHTTRDVEKRTLSLQYADADMPSPDTGTARKKQKINHSVDNAREELGKDNLYEAETKESLEDEQKARAEAAEMSEVGTERKTMPEADVEVHPESETNELFESAEKADLGAEEEEEEEGTSQHEAVAVVKPESEEQTPLSTAEDTKGDSALKEQETLYTIVGNTTEGPGQETLSENESKEMFEVEELTTAEATELPGVETEIKAMPEADEKVQPESKPIEPFKSAETADLGAAMEADVPFKSSVGDADVGVSSEIIRHSVSATSNAGNEKGTSQHEAMAEVRPELEEQMLLSTAEDTKGDALRKTQEILYTIDNTTEGPGQETLSANESKETFEIEQLTTAEATELPGVETEIQSRPEADEKVQPESEPIDPFKSAETADLGAAEADVPFKSSVGDADVGFSSEIIRHSASTTSAAGNEEGISQHEAVVEVKPESEKQALLSTAEDTKEDSARKEQKMPLVSDNTREEPGNEALSEVETKESLEDEKRTGAEATKMPGPETEREAMPEADMKVHPEGETNDAFESAEKADLGAENPFGTSVRDSDAGYSPEIMPHSAPATGTSSGNVPQARFGVEVVVSGIAGNEEDTLQHEAVMEVNPKSGEQTLLSTAEDTKGDSARKKHNIFYTIDNTMEEPGKEILPENASKETQEGEQLTAAEAIKLPGVETEIKARPEADEKVQPESEPIEPFKFAETADLGAAEEDVPFKSSVGDPDDGLNSEIIQHSASTTSTSSGNVPQSCFGVEVVVTATAGNKIGTLQHEAEVKPESEKQTLLSIAGATKDDSEEMVQINVEKEHLAEVEDEANLNVAEPPGVDTKEGTAPEVNEEAKAETEQNELLESPEKESLEAQENGSPRAASGGAKRPEANLDAENTTMEDAPPATASEIGRAAADEAKASGLWQSLEIGLAVVDAMKAKQCAPNDILFIAGEIAAGVAHELTSDLAPDVALRRVASEVAEVVKAAGGSSADVANVVGKVSANIAKEAGLWKPSEIAAAAADAASSVGCSASEVAHVASTIAIEAAPESGISMEDLPRLAAGAAAHAAKATGALEPNQIAGPAAEAAKMAGASSQDIAKIVSDIAIEHAKLGGMWRTEELADAAANALKCIDCSSAVVFDVIGEYMATAEEKSGTSQLVMAEKVAETVKSAGGSLSDAVQVVGKIFANAARKAGVPSYELVATVANSVKVAGGSQEAAIKIATDAASRFAEESATPLTVGRIGDFAVQATKAVGGSLTDIAMALVGAVVPAASAQQSPAEVAEIAADIARSAGLILTGVVKVAGASAAKVAKARGLSNTEVAEHAALAAKAAGGSQEHVTQAAGDAAAEAAQVDGLPPQKVGELVARVAEAAGASKADVINAACDAVTVAATEAQWQPASVAKSLATLVLELGGSSEDVAAAAGRGAAKAAIAAGSSPAVVAVAAGDATKAEGGADNLRVKIMSEAATRAAKIAGGSPGDVAQIVVSILKEAGASHLEIIQAACDAAADTARDAGASPMEVGKVVANAVSAAGGSPVDVSRALVDAVLKTACVSGESACEAPRIVAEAVKAAGGLPEDTVRSAGRAAANVARASGESEEELAKISARAELQESVSLRVVVVLEATIQHGIAAGLLEAELDAARVTLKEEMDKISALACVQEALQSREIAALRSAIEKATSANVLPAKFSDAVDALKEEELKAAARDLLHAAVQSRTISDLHLAIERGLGANLDAPELEEAKNTLREEQLKERARDGLVEATRCRSIPVLLDWIAQAEGTCLPADAPELTAARVALQEEQEKEESRNQLAEAVLSQEIGALQAAIARGETANLETNEFEEAKHVLRQAKARVEIASSTAAAEEAMLGDADALSKVAARLQAAIEEACWAGLDESELRVAELALTDAIRQRWRLLLVAGPPNMGGALLLSSLEDILQQNFDLEFLEQHVFNCLQAGAHGAPPSELALALQRMRSADVSAFAVQGECGLDTALQRLEAVLIAGIDASGRQNVPELPGFDDALIWLDLSNELPEESRKQSAVNDSLCGLKDAVVPCFSVDSLTPLDVVAPSGLIGIDLHFQGPSAVQLYVRYYDCTGAVLWASSLDEAELWGESETPMAAVSKRIATKHKPGVASARLDLEQVPADVFAIGVSAHSVNWKKIKAASLSLTELTSSERHSLSEGRPSKGNLCLGSNVTSELKNQLDGSVCGIAIVCREILAGQCMDACVWKLQGLLLAETVGHEKNRSLRTARCVGADLPEADDAFSTVVREAYQQAANPEAVLVGGHVGLGEVADPAQPACLRCCELSQAFSTSTRRSRCVITGALRSTGHAGAMEVALGAGLLQDARTLLRAKAHFMDSTDIFTDESFYALADHVGLQPPGDRSVLVRVGRCVGLPLATVRGAWGFEHTLLCDLQFTSAITRPSSDDEATARAAEARGEVRTALEGLLPLAGVVKSPKLGEYSGVLVPKQL